MTTTDIAKDLVALCNAGDNMTAIERYYSPQIVSREVNEPMKEIRGIDGVKAKAAWWFENHDVHSRATRGPWVNDNHFAVEHTFDITFKPTGRRFTMNEIAVYTVLDEKIVGERFMSPA
jgi:hypothetical protein